MGRDGCVGGQALLIALLGVCVGVSVSYPRGVATPATPCTTTAPGFTATAIGGSGALPTAHQAPQQSYVLRRLSQDIDEITRSVPEATLRAHALHLSMGRVLAQVGCADSAAAIGGSQVSRQGDAVPDVRVGVPPSRDAAGGEHVPPGVAPVVVVFAGTRPEVIKTALLVAQLRRMQAEGALRVVYASTGQHEGLVTDLLADLGVAVDHHMGGVMQPGQPLWLLQSKLLAAVGQFLASPSVKNEAGGPPALVIVQGDTTSAAAAAQAAYLSGIPVGHVEAGLRTYDLGHPFPEEANRQAITRIASLHFAPTELSAMRLRAEGVHRDTVWVTGNTGIDAVMARLTLLDGDERRRTQAWHTLEATGIADVVAAAAGCRSAAPHYSDAQCGSGPIVRVVVLTCHRRENLIAPMANIFAAAAEVVASSERGDLVDSVTGRQVALHVIVPAHPNPDILAAAQGAFNELQQAHVVPPLPFGALQTVLRAAHFVITDSGGILEEASCVHRVPVLCIRRVTERYEVVETGAVLVVGDDGDALLSLSRALATNTSGWRSSPSCGADAEQGCERGEATSLYASMSASAGMVYGDGNASVRIAAAVAGHLSR